MLVPANGARLQAHAGLLASLGSCDHAVGAADTLIGPIATTVSVRNSLFGERIAMYLTCWC